MIIHKEYKSILTINKNPNMWFGVNYNINPYRGCEHKCIYCDSRADCYNVGEFDGDIIVKSNAVELLDRELRGKRTRPVIGFGAMCDPYTPAELDEKITRGCLKVLSNHRLPTNIITKSNLILRDKDILKDINENYLNVAFTITTPHDEVSSVIEPGAPSSSERFKAMSELANLGAKVGITLMPILPEVTDKEEDIRELVKMGKEHGASYIYPYLGVSLKNGQREYLFDALEEYDERIKQEYIKSYGNGYYANPKHYKKLNEALKEECYKRGIKIGSPKYKEGEPTEQLSLFE